MTTLKALEEIKTLMNDTRGKLLTRRTQLYKRLKSGNEFFQSNKQYTKAELAKASELMVNIQSELMSVEKEIFDIDVIIATKLETLLTDCEIRITTAPKKNDMSELVGKSDFIIDYFNDKEKTTVTPEDLWILKIIKPALKYCNIEINKKSGQELF